MNSAAPEICAHRLRTSVTLLLFLAFALVHFSAAAQSIAPGTTSRFNIPSQPLDAGLAAFGSASHMQVLYETALASGRRSTEVDGVYTQEDALRLLLSGTGLDFEYTEERAFTVVPTKAPTARPVTDFFPFLGKVQAGVLAALCRQAKSRPGKFRTAMQFWIGTSGKIESPTLLSSAGSDERDAAIVEALTHVDLNKAPPSDMPQPITMVLTASNGEDECAGVRG